MPPRLKNFAYLRSGAELGETFRAEEYSGLIALSSWLPAELAHSYLAVPAHQLLPTLVQHGLEDPMVSIDRATESLRLLRELGVPVTFSDYPMAHEISPESLRDLSRWLGGEALQ